VRSKILHALGALALMGCLAATGIARAEDTQPAGSEPPQDNGNARVESQPQSPIGVSPQTQSPIGVSPQTKPAKFDPAVAAQDRIPIMARPLPLTDEQKHQIYASVMGNRQASADQAAVAAKPGSVLSGTADLATLPPGVEDQIPAVRGYKYVTAPDKVLLGARPAALWWARSTSDALD